MAIGGGSDLLGVIGGNAGLGCGCGIGCNIWPTIFLLAHAFPCLFLGRTGGIIPCGWHIGLGITIWAWESLLF